MRDKCFDEGVIQAFFDGELASDLLEKVARHVGACEKCAFLVSEIETESASVSAAFERENFELVPTERLRTKIFAEIAEFENGRTSWLQKAAAALGFSKGIRWSGPSVAAFASLVFVVGVVGLVLISQPDATQQPIASRPSGLQTTKPPINEPVPEDRGPSLSSASSAPTQPVNPMIRQAVYAPAKTAPGKSPVASAGLHPLADEERYLQTINTLKKSVDSRKDSMLKPSALVSYERDMAVVDNAINKMQKVVRKNPKDEASKQILLASYQNKIDLLSAVSDKTELMASLR